MTSSPYDWAGSLRLLGAGFTFAATLTMARAADPAATLPADLIERLEAAKNPAEQDRVIGGVAAEISGEVLRKAILTRAYQLTLTGEYLRAAADCDLVLRLAHEAGAEDDAAAARIELAFVLRECGDLGGALGAINQAVDYYEAHPEDAHGRISAHQARGIIYLVQSDFAHALQSLQRALTLSEKIKYREGIIPALNSIGEVYRTQGQPERALEYYEKARQAVGDDNAWNMAFIFNNIGMSYDARGDLDRAVQFIDRARAVAEKAGFRPRVENSLAVLGDLELKRGHLDAARDDYEASLKLARELRDVSGEAQATLGAAKVAHARGDEEAALSLAQKAATLSRQIAQLDQLVPALTLSGRSLRALQREKEAAAAFEEAIAAVEEMRGRVAGGEVERETFFSQQIEPYHAMVSLLVRQNKAAEALAMAERASARVLLDITSGGRAETAAVLTEEERKAQREIDLKLADAQRQSARLRTADKRDESAIAKNEASRRELQKELEHFEALIRSAHPELRRTAVPEPLASLAAAGPLLRDGKTALLRFVVTGEESFLFLLTRPPEASEPQLQVVSLGKKRAELTSLTDDFRSRLAARSLAWEKPAREFYDLLLRPVEEQLRGVESLVIVPDGPLWELPFQVLEKKVDQPLLAAYTIRYAPSLALLSRLENSAPAGSPEPALLAFVNPALSEKGPSRVDERQLAAPAADRETGARAPGNVSAAGRSRFGGSRRQRDGFQAGSGPGRHPAFRDARRARRSGAALFLPPLFPSRDRGGRWPPRGA